MTAPSKETSTKGEFPIALPSPVWAIIDMQRRYKGIAKTPSLALVREEDEDTPETTAVSGNDSPLIHSPSPADSGVEGDEEMEMVADIIDALRPTSAGFLVSTSPLKSTSRLADPIIQAVPAHLWPNYAILRTGRSDLEHATRAELITEVKTLRMELQKALAVSKIERAINEGANTQLLLWDWHLQELTERLHTKEEERSKGKRGRMGRANARWLSGKPFLDELRGDAGRMGGGAPVDEMVEPVEPLMPVEEDEEFDPTETKSQWRQCERWARLEKQKAALKSWEAAVADCERRGVPAPGKPKVRKLFPALATPTRFTAKRAPRRKRRGAKRVKGVEDDADYEGEGKDREDSNDD
ncbi:hypothetical protein M407DRAFT_25019 [Tulasnella calospora MUT 4182]|uniref:Uncharacterized protein n=1 Tax=Tulasnella calospora MUT 4182 TaxID=1051891 RepID=A0A0C3LW69_9AGAM|nr:hypothetical protein M407DRAFT_25019 [Tulasnella calospora MUT 4182]